MDVFSACFSRRPQRTAASQYLEGLFNDSERKSMQAMHGRLGDPGSYEALQHFITDSPWDAERGWARLRTLVPGRQGVVDPHGARALAHVRGGPAQGPVHLAEEGKTANCQV